MKIINEIKNIKKSIIQLLTTHPHLRDDDYKLIANVWYSQLIDSNISAKEFLRILSTGKLCNSESIRRCRQKVQEQNPHLRGKNYLLRVDESIEMRSEIHKV